MTSVLWLRRDLRLGDHPALAAAHDAAGAGGVLPVFVADPTLLASAGTARVAALHEALAGARESFDDALVVRHGRPEEVLPALAREVRAASVHASAETTRAPTGRTRTYRTPTGRAARHDRQPVCRHSGPDPHGRRDPVPGLHPLLACVAGPRLAPTRRGAGRVAMAPGCDLRTVRVHCRRRWTGL